MTTRPRPGDHELIVTFTSYPPRFPSLHLVVESLLRQSLKADRIVLWVNDEDYGELPSNLLNLQGETFIVERVSGRNIGSYRKLIPALEAYPNAILVTCDDDVYYYSNWLWDLYITSLREDHKTVICHRANLWAKNGEPFTGDYLSWMPLSSYDDVKAANVFPTGIGGILYPPTVFHPNVCNVDEFMTVAPRQDDVWFFFMTWLNGVSKRKIATNFDTPTPISGSQDVALWRDNLIAGGNDQAVGKMLELYPVNLDVKPAGC